MSRYHIVMLTRILPHHSIGGMQAIAWDLARQFAIEGVRVTVLTTRIPGKPAHFDEDGVEIVALQDTPPARYSTAWWKSSREYFKNNLLDSATCVFSVSAAAYGLLSLKAQLSGVPFILQAHGTSLGEIISKLRTHNLKSILSTFRNFVWLIKDLHAYPKFDVIVAVGERVHKSLNRPPFCWFLPPGGVRLINNGIDTRLFSHDLRIGTKMRTAFGLSEKERIVISASRLHRQKGLANSLRGFAYYALRDPLARYIILGDGPEENNLKRLAKELSIDDKVIFAGAVKREYLPDYLSMGDVFLFTTVREEGLPLNVLEALSIGLPVVVSQYLASKFHGNPYVIGVNPNDSEAIARAMSRAFAIRQSYEEIKSRLPKEYSLSYSARQYIELIRNLSKD